MKLRDALSGNARKQFPPQAYEKFGSVSDEQIADWQNDVKEQYKLEEGDWELLDGASAS